MSNRKFLLILALALILVGSIALAFYPKPRRASEPPLLPPALVMAEASSALPKETEGMNMAKKEILDICVERSMIFLAAEDIVFKAEGKFKSPKDTSRIVSLFLEHAEEIALGHCGEILPAEFEANPELKDAFDHAQYFILHRWFYPRTVPLDTPDSFPGNFYKKSGEGLIP